MDRNEELDVAVAIRIIEGHLGRKDILPAIDWDVLKDEISRILGDSGSKLLLRMLDRYIDYARDCPGYQLAIDRKNKIISMYVDIMDMEWP